MSGSKVQWEQQNITNNVKAVLGPKTWSHQNWFHENHESIWATLDAKNKAYAEWQRGPSSTSKVQTELRKMQDLCWQKKAELFRHPQSKTVRQCHKTVYGPSISGFFPLLSFDGSSFIRTRKDSTLLNRPSTVAKVVLQHVSQQPVMEGLDQPPTTDEGKKASSPWIPTQCQVKTVSQLRS